MTDAQNRCDRRGRHTDAAPAFFLPPPQKKHPRPLAASTERCMFAVLNIKKEATMIANLNAVGIFYASRHHIEFRPPCGVLNGLPASFKVLSNGKAGLFCFIPSRKQTYCTTH